MHPQQDPRNQAQAASAVRQGLDRVGTGKPASRLGSQVCQAKANAGTSALARRTWRLPKSSVINLGPRMEEGMRRRICAMGGLAAVLSMLPSWVWAAGEKAGDLVVVADTRTLSGWNLYFATLYNEDMWLFATWAVILTTAMGMGLGLIMDFIMKRTGIDLHSRKIVEH